MAAPRPGQHAAKAKKHIYSSGAAGTGGKAEPTNAKNAGQPIECPLCDRIFKQDGRLKVRFSQTGRLEACSVGSFCEGDLSRMHSRKAPVHLW